MLARIEDLERRYLPTHPIRLTDSEVLDRLSGKSKLTPNTRSPVHLGCAATLTPMVEKAAAVRAARAAPVAAPQPARQPEYLPGTPVVSEVTGTEHQRWEWQRQHPLAEYGGDGAPVQQKLVPDHV
jgi:hypothetical protein